MSRRFGQMHKAAEVCENLPAPLSRASPLPKTQPRSTPSGGMLRAVVELPRAAPMACLRQDTDSPASSRTAPIGTAQADLPPSPGSEGSSGADAEIAEAPTSAPRSRPPSSSDAGKDRRPSPSQDPTSTP